MNRITEDYLAKVNFGEIQTFKNMAVLPVFQKEYNGLDHLTLNEALEQGALMITELSQAG